MIRVTLVKRARRWCSGEVCSFCVDGAGWAGWVPVGEPPHRCFSHSGAGVRGRVEADGKGRYIGPDFHSKYRSIASRSEHSDAVLSIQKQLHVAKNRKMEAKNKQTDEKHSLPVRRIISLGRTLAKQVKAMSIENQQTFGERNSRRHTEKEGYSRTWEWKN